MEQLYQSIVQQVTDGAHLSVNFKSRSLRINNKPVSLKDQPLGIETFSDLDQWLDRLEDHYDAYKYSRPTKTAADKERHAYFKALSPDELVKECGHGALNNPTSRDEAQASLELFILFSLLNGSFRPEELFVKDWFFQGSDKDLILRKDWFI